MADQDEAQLGVTADDQSETRDSGIERILVVTAHPDDVDFGAAATVAVWTDRGIDVSYCVVTDGDAGGFDRDVPRSSIPSIRRSEQTEAAKRVGVRDLHWLGHPDGRVEANLALRRDIARVIRIVRPQRVVCQSPQRNFDRIYASHPDHLAVGEATLCAVYPDARNPFTFPELLDEGLDAWTVSEVWMMGGPKPDIFVDVTDTIDRKIEALRCHMSQTSHMENLDEMIRAWLSGGAQAAGWGEGRYAESFLRIATG